MAAAVSHSAQLTQPETIAPSPTLPSSASAEPLCSECASFSAKLHCPTCASDLCHKCAGEVHRPRVLQSHQLISLAEKKRIDEHRTTQQAKEAAMRCSTHADQKLYFWCHQQGCQRRICAMCAVSSHSTHRREEIHAAAAKFRSTPNDSSTEIAEMSAVVDQLDQDQQGECTVSESGCAITSP
jgi:hypothetical protein